VRIVFSMLLSALALAITAGAPQAERAARGELTILISLDGFRADYLDRGLTPTLSSLAADGVRSAMAPAFPSITFPNHVTLLTGLFPDHHGVVANTFEDRDLGKVWRLNNRQSATDPDLWRGPVPLWATAEAQGQRAGAAFWPIVGVDAAGKPPGLLLPLDPGTPALDEADKVLSWLDLPSAQRPRLILLYFGRVDGVGHQFGPDSPQMDAVLTETDAAIGRLVDGLKARGLFQRTNMIVVADHGMTGISKDRVVELDSLVDLKRVRILATGAVVGVEPRPGFAPQVEAALLGRHGRMVCWRKGETPARFHYGASKRIPPIVCLADVGWEIVTKGTASFWPGDYRGDHGFDPDAPDMAALFIAHGPAFRRGVAWPKFSNVDVYPLTAAIAGLQPEPNDGVLADVIGMTVSPGRRSHPPQHKVDTARLKPEHGSGAG